MKLINRFINDKEGQGLVEYTLIVGFIGLVCIVAIGEFGGNLKNLLVIFNSSINTVIDKL